MWKSYMEVMSVPATDMDIEMQNWSIGFERCSNHASVVRTEFLTAIFAGGQRSSLMLRYFNR